jgi:hypothetical protein
VLRGVDVLAHGVDGGEEATVWDQIAGAQLLPGDRVRPGQAKEG